MVELCTLYRLKENEIADEIIAFAITKQFIKLTAESLHIFEHEVSELLEGIAGDRCFDLPI